MKIRETIDETDVLDIICQALKAQDDAHVSDVTYDNDHKSGEMILTTEDISGKKRTWVIRSGAISEADATGEAGE